MTPLHSNLHRRHDAIEALACATRSPASCRKRLRLVIAFYGTALLFTFSFSYTAEPRGHRGPISGILPRCALVPSQLE